MKVAVVGSRNIDSYSLVKEELDIIFNNMNVGTIISGGAKGVDSLAERYARENKIPFIEILPDWRKHGIQAGVIRNTEIVDKCDVLVAFWDGSSKGTLDSINKATKKGKKVFIFKIN